MVAAAAVAAYRARRPLLVAGGPLPPPILGPVLPFTPRPPLRLVGPWRPRIRPELRTIRERVVIYYTLADLPVAAFLAVTGWPVEGAW